MRSRKLLEGKSFLTRRSGFRVALGFLLIIAGCSSSGSSTPGSGTPTFTRTTGEATAEPCGPTTTARTETVAPEDRPPGLEFVLYGLVTADDRAAYASNHDLRLRNGSVEVTFELRDGADVPPEFDVEVETRHENLVQAFVPVCELVPLSEHENVSYVRSPRRPVPDEPSPDTTDT